MKKNLVIGLLTTALIVTSVSTGVLVYDKVSSKPEVKVSNKTDDKVSNKPEVHGKYTQEYLDEVSVMCSEWEIDNIDERIGRLQAPASAYFEGDVKDMRTATTYGTNRLSLGYMSNDIYPSESVFSSVRLGDVRNPSTSKGKDDWYERFQNLHILSNVEVIGERCLDGMKLDSLVFDEIDVDAGGAYWQQFRNLVICDYAFFGLEVEEINLPDGIRYMGNRVFSDVKGLKTIRMGTLQLDKNMHKETGIYIFDEAFQDMDVNVVLEVPNDKLTVEHIKVLEREGKIPCKIKYL